MSNGRPTINREVPPAPTDIRLRTFLVSLSRKIETQDLAYIKFLLKGDVGEGVLEGCQSPIDLFDRLIRRGWLNENNIVILQALVWAIDRIDLYNKMVEFARENRNILHIGPSTSTPENGCTYARFHLHGEPHRQRAEDMRSEIANWLCVPKYMVVVARVEETGSWTITFMIPEVCVQTLIMPDQAQKQRLVELGVVTFEVDGQVFNILPITTGTVSPDELTPIHQYVSRKEHVFSKTESEDGDQLTSQSFPDTEEHDVEGRQSSTESGWTGDAAKQWEVILPPAPESENRETKTDEAIPAQTSTWKPQESSLLPGVTMLVGTNAGGADSGPTDPEAPSNTLEEELRCPICKDFFKDPVSLGCRHCFCRDCLQRIVDIQESNPEEAKGILSCPECRSTFHITEGSVENLRPDFKLAGIVGKFLIDAKTSEKLKEGMIKQMEKCQDMKERVSAQCNKTEAVNNWVKDNAAIHNKNIENTYKTTQSALETWREKAVLRVKEFQLGWETVMSDLRTKASELDRCTDLLKNLLRTDSGKHSNASSQQICTRIEGELSKTDEALKKAKVCDPKDDTLPFRLLHLKEKAISRIKLNFTKSSDRCLEITAGGSLIQGPAVLPQGDYSAWTDGWLTEGQVFWEIQISGSPSEGKHYAWCRAGVLQGTFGLWNRRSNKIYSLGAEYCDDKVNYFIDSELDNGSVSPVYRDQPTPHSGSIWLGFYLDFDKRTMTVVDCSSDEKKVMYSQTDMDVSQALVPFVGFMGSFESASAYLVPSTEGISELPEILNDIVDW